MPRQTFDTPTVAPADTRRGGRVRASSVPICPATSRADRPGAPVPRSACRDVIALYLAVSLYVTLDVAVFHLLSGWVTAVLETAELAPILLGAFAYWRTRPATRVAWSGLPRIVVVPIVATAIQLEMLGLSELCRVLMPA